MGTLVVCKVNLWKCVPISAKEDYKYSKWWQEREKPLTAGSYCHIDGVGEAVFFVQQLVSGSEGPGFVVSLAEETSGRLPRWIHSNDGGDVQSRLQGP